MHAPGRASDYHSLATRQASSVNLTFLIVYAIVPYGPTNHAHRPSCSSLATQVAQAHSAGRQERVASLRQAKGALTADSRQELNGPPEGIVPVARRQKVRDDSGSMERSSETGDDRVKKFY